MAAIAPDAGGQAIAHGSIGDDVSEPSWLLLTQLPPGLINLGNSCFMNSMLQALASSSRFCDHMSRQAAAVRCGSERVREAEAIIEAATRQRQQMRRQQLLWHHRRTRQQQQRQQQEGGMGSWKLSETVAAEAAAGAIEGLVRGLSRAVLWIEGWEPRAARLPPSQPPLHLMASAPASTTSTSTTSRSPADHHPAAAAHLPRLAASRLLLQLDTTLRALQPRYDVRPSSSVSVSAPPTPSRPGVAAAAAVAGAGRPLNPSGLLAALRGHLEGDTLQEGQQNDAAEALTCLCDALDAELAAWQILYGRWLQDPLYGTWLQQEALEAVSSGVDHAGGGSGGDSRISDGGGSSWGSNSSAGGSAGGAGGGDCCASGAGGGGEAGAVAVCGAGRSGGCEGIVQGLLGSCVAPRDAAGVDELAATAAATAAPGTAGTGSGSRSGSGAATVVWDEAGAARASTLEAALPERPVPLSSTPSSSPSASSAACPAGPAPSCSSTPSMVAPTAVACKTGGVGVGADCNGGTQGPGDSGGAGLGQDEGGCGCAEGSGSTPQPTPDHAAAAAATTANLVGNDGGTGPVAFPAPADGPAPVDGLTAPAASSASSCRALPDGGPGSLLGPGLFRGPAAWGLPGSGSLSSSSSPSPSWRPLGPLRGVLERTTTCTVCGCMSVTQLEPFCCLQLRLPQPGQPVEEEGVGSPLGQQQGRDTPGTTAEVAPAAPAASGGRERPCQQRGPQRDGEEGRAPGPLLAADGPAHGKNRGGETAPEPVSRLGPEGQQEQQRRQPQEQQPAAQPPAPPRSALTAATSPSPSDLRRSILAIQRDMGLAGLRMSSLPASPSLPAGPSRQEAGVNVNSGSGGDGSGAGGHGTPRQRHNNQQASARRSTLGRLELGDCIRLAFKRDTADGWACPRCSLRAALAALHATCPLECPPASPSTAATGASEPQSPTSRSPAAWWSSCRTAVDRLESLLAGPHLPDVDLDTEMAAASAALTTLLHSASSSSSSPTSSTVAGNGPSRNTASGASAAAATPPPRPHPSANLGGASVGASAGVGTVRVRAVRRTRVASWPAVLVLQLLRTAWDPWASCSNQGQPPRGLSPGAAARGSGF